MRIDVSTHNSAYPASSYQICSVNVMRFANRILLSTNWSTERRPGRSEDREGEKTELRSGEGAMPENGTLHIIRCMSAQSTRVIV